MNKAFVAPLVALLLPAIASAQTMPATSTPTTTTSRTTAPVQTNAATPAMPATPAHRMPAPRTAPAMPTAPVNVNTATAAQLSTLPGVSSKLAADIIKNRAYKNADDLVKKVKGIGKNNVKQMMPYLRF